MKKKPTVGVIGTGNLGWNLALRLYECGYDIIGIHGAQNEPNQKLAKRIESKLVKKAETLADKANVLFICVPDDHIQEVAKRVEHSKTVICHCSGSTPFIEGKFAGSGVLYPFQTFTKFFPVDWNNITTFVEGSNPETSKLLLKIAHKISADGVEVKFEQRRAIHIAGVIGANFTNHLLYHAEQLLDTHGIEFEVLRPLMEESVRKAFEHGPAGAQTGPAKRDDQKVIKRHLEFLGQNPQLQDLYRQLSKGISESTHSSADDLPR